MDRLNEERSDGTSERSREEQRTGEMLGAGKREEDRPGTPAGSAQGGVGSVDHRDPPLTGEISNAQAGSEVEGEPQGPPDAGNSALNGLRDANHYGG